MTSGTKALIWLTLGIMTLLGFLLGYGLHLNTAIQRFAGETNRSSEDYSFSVVWMHPPDGGTSYPALLAVPVPGASLPMEVRTRWRWSNTNPNEPCDPEEHRLVWRVRKDAWELVDDLEKDLSVPLFPEDAEAP